MSLPIHSSLLRAHPSADRAACESIAAAQGFLLDWDGCVALGNRPQPDAVRFIAARLDRVAIVSNNSTDTPADLAGILAAAGAPIPAERVILAGAETLAHAMRMGAQRALVIGDPRIKAYGRKLGLRMAEKEEPDLVVLLRDRRFTYAKLQRAANALRQGARLLVANPDLTHPGSNGRVVPETGALLAALMACAGPGIEPEVVGKPFPTLFQRACTAIGMEPREVLMIGDNPQTDIRGALAMGLDAVLMGPGGAASFADLVAGA